MKSFQRLKANLRRSNSSSSFSATPLPNQAFSQDDTPVLPDEAIKPEPIQRIENRSIEAVSFSQQATVMQRQSQYDQITSVQQRCDSLGVDILVDPESAKLDIVFVHGLMGKQNTTWTANTATEPWPKLLLSTDIPNARMIMYGYDADVIKWTRPAGLNTVRENANNLVNDLVFLRRDTDSLQRPIVFVAHSLGGIVCQEALVLSSNPTDDAQRDILSSTNAIALLGTPHAGSDLRSFADYAAKLLAFKRPNTDVLEVLHKRSQVLGEIVNNFHALMRNRSRENQQEIKLHAFIEEMPLSLIGKRVVTPDSARLPGYNSSTIPANHTEMVRFNSRQDVGYQRLKGVLKGWSDEIQAIHSKIPVGPISRLDLTPEQCELLKSISFPEMETRKHNILDSADDTCEWLLDHPTYMSWLQDSSEVLWIKGHPGAGKSTVMKKIIQSCNRPGEIMVSFFFNARGALIEQIPFGLYRALLHQLLPYSYRVLSALGEIYKDRCDTRGEYGNKWKWQEEELRKWLEELLLTQVQVIRIYIDALDESGEDNAIRLASHFKNWVRKTTHAQGRVYVCFACRHYPSTDIDCLTIYVEKENQADIQTYVRRKFEDSAVHNKHDVEVLESDILARAKGIFQWIILVLPRIMKHYLQGNGLQATRDLIKRVPPMLNELYRDIFDQIPNHERDNTLYLMQWICFAESMLSLQQLYYVLMIYENNSQEPLRNAILTEPSLRDLERVKMRAKHLTRGLVEFVPRTFLHGIGEGHLIIQFVHQSVADFLIQEGLQLLGGGLGNVIGQGHLRIAWSCICYIGVVDFALDSTPTQDSLSSQLMQKIPSLKLGFFTDPPFLTEHVVFWTEHFNVAYNLNIPLDDLLSVFELLYFPSPCLMERGQLPCRSGRINIPLLDGGTVLHLTATYGWEKMLPYVLSNGTDTINASNRRMQTPFFCAAHSGHINIVKHLLGRENIEANLKDDDGNAPLHCAVMNGHESIVKLLLEQENIKINIKDKHDDTPLHYAAKLGCEVIVKLLLERKEIKVNLGSRHGFTPLHYAAMRGHGGIVKLLLEREDEINLINEDNNTPLHYAISRNHETEVKRLLKREDIMVNRENGYPYTPLFYAVCGGYEEIVKLLLMRDDTMVHSKLTNGFTLLHKAVKRGNEAIVELLLQKGGIDINSRNYFNETPLHVAVQTGNINIIKLLLQCEHIDIYARDLEEKTVFDYRMDHGIREKMLRMFQEQGLVTQVVAQKYIRRE